MTIEGAELKYTTILAIRDFVVQFCTTIIGQSCTWWTELAERAVGGICVLSFLAGYACL
jgi:hypothetical protein